jgi:hypothetical protein
MKDKLNINAHTRVLKKKGKQVWAIKQGTRLIFWDTLERYSKYVLTALH